MPVNTRWLLLMMVVVTLTGNFGLAPMDLLYFDPEKVLKFQVRRAMQRSACTTAWRAVARCDLKTSRPHDLATPRPHMPGVLRLYRFGGW